jgi:hypothetical protein
VASRKLRIVRNIALTLVVLLVVGVVALILSINWVARRGIEAGASSALGVPTTLNAARVGIFSGTFGLSGLNVANPPGFDGPTFLGLGRGDVEVSLGSLFSDTITVPSLTLDRFTINLQRKATGSNYGVILDNLAKGGSREPQPTQPAGEGKRLIINELVLTNIEVGVDMLGLPGEGSPVGAVTGTLNQVAAQRITIPEIRLTNVGRTGQGVAGTGVTIKDLSGIVLQAVLSAAMNKGGLPADVVSDLQKGLANLPDTLKNVGTGVVGAVGGAVGGAADEARKAAERAAEEAGKGLKGVGDGIRGLLPGSK